MKKISLILVTTLLLTTFIACNDNFMEQYPKSELSPITYFKNEKEIKTYTNAFYQHFPTGDKIYYNAPYYADDDARSSVSDILRGTRIVPSSGGGWSWSNLRSVNYYLKYSSQCDDVRVRTKYDAFARFFRAYFYLEKIQNFGDVPWHDTVLDLDDEELYKARDSREFIFDKMLEDIDNAIEHLDKERKVYEVTKWTALALKSRMCLFEGTYRKHHGIAGWEEILDQCILASQELITESGYRIYTSSADKAYHELFTFENANIEEMILARQHIVAISTHQLNTYTTSPSFGKPGVTRQVVQSYLMKDGSRFTDIADYEKMEFKDECADRDPRLSQTIRTPGYKRIGETSLSMPDFSASVTGYQYSKFVMQKSFDVGRNTNDLPIFRYAEVLLNYAEAKAERGTIKQADIDMSIKLLRDRVGMPNLSVSDANANPDPFMEKQYEYVDQGINKGVILEIRRERRIELIREGHRWHDLMRWKAGKLLEKKYYGMYFPGIGSYDLDGNGTIDVVIYEGSKPQVTAPTQTLELGVDIVFDNKAREGQIWCNPNIDKHWDEERDYLYPIPSQERMLNPNLKQNPNWIDDLSN